MHEIVDEAPMIRRRCRTIKQIIEVLYFHRRHHRG